MNNCGLLQGNSAFSAVGVLLRAVFFIISPLLCLVRKPSHMVIEYGLPKNQAASASREDKCLLL